MTLDELYSIFDAMQPDENGCHIWPLAKNRDGYGNIKLGDKYKNTHRLALERKLNVSLPSNIHALHTCDNPACVNPKHLFAGTHKDNMSDKLGKGRTTKGKYKGAKNPNYGPGKLNRIGSKNPMFGMSQSLKCKLIVQMNNIMRFNPYWGA